MRNGTLAAAIAMALAAGCSAAATAGPRRPGAGGTSAAGGADGGTQAGDTGTSDTADPWSRPGLLAALPLRDGPAAVPGLSQTPNAHAASSTLWVGALFEGDASGEPFCTASVVASPGQDLLITAAHCINNGDGNGYMSDIVFVPGYHDGAAPYGIWTARRLLVAPQWASSSDPDFDVGFVVLQPHDGKNIQQVLGANRLGYDSGYQYLVRVTGYPSSAERPVTCVNWTSRQSDSQLQFSCDGYTDGTSGSPWVTNLGTQSQPGTIVGVLGGYQEGGDTSSVSYSAYLGSAVHQLYERAISDDAEGGQG